MGPRCAMLLMLFLCSTTTHFSAGLIIYKDVISGDEMFSDSDTYKVKVTDDDIFYEVEGKVVTRSDRTDDSLIGNAMTAEEMTEFADSSVTSVVDIILNHHLQEIQFTEDQYVEYLKGYFKKVKKHLEQEQPDRVEAFMAAAGPAFRNILQTDFKDWQFFTGETKNREGMVALLNYREDGVTPYMLFTKDGLKEERV